MIRVADLARIIENTIPLSFALHEDNCGLQIGSPSLPVKGVMVALDPSEKAVAKAVRAGANLLVTHHPLFYEPLRRLDPSTQTGGAAVEAVKAGLAIYSAHTNLDAAPGGLSTELARRLDLKGCRFFSPTNSDGFAKIAVFVPVPSAPAVHRAMSQAGAGAIGNYDSCGFMVKGEGIFRPLKGSRPAIGTRGTLERVEEVRLEMLVEEHRAAQVIAAMRQAHPYEEPAFDHYPLRPVLSGGLGCVGDVSRVKYTEFARHASEVFKAEVRVSGSPPSTVRRIAVVPGSGGSLVEAAAREGADLLVTGEIRYHQMLEAENRGMGVVELGHDRSEMPAVDLLAGILRAGLPGRGKKLPVKTFRRSPAGRLLK